MSLTSHAIAIWQAGVEAVGSERLVRNVILRAGDHLEILGYQSAISQLGRIIVVGAGKAGAGMAAAVEEALGTDVVHDKVVGWVNVPANCLRSLSKINLHAGRPTSVNEPTPQGVLGSERILELVSHTQPDDLCLVLISGGGSALLPAPKPPLTLNDKLSTAQFLIRNGATIQELNAVRKRLSRIKGGGLARACRAKKLIGLIISDVVGDPMDMVASGPTVADTTTDQQALAILRKYSAKPPFVPRRVIEFLKSAVDRKDPEPPFPDNVSNHIIANNQMALDAAAKYARDLGYNVRSLGSDNCGVAGDEGRALAKLCRSLRDDPQIRRPLCILSGGETTVRLSNAAPPPKGGRNQEWVLAGLAELFDDGMNRIVILSGGTDGEDGPTDAAGAWADARVLERAIQQRLEVGAFLVRHDSYSFFEQAGGLLKTGPTHTNVMDLRVALIDI